MKRAFILLVFLLAVSLIATNVQPANPSNVKTPERIVPVWKSLEELSTSRKDNAVIEVELFNNPDEKDLNNAEIIADTWNSGNYAEAIDLLKDFESNNEVAVGINWKKPIKTDVDFGDDVLISPIDSVKVLTFDIDNTTGNLFVGLSYNGQSTDWSINFSDDGGNTWSETYTWNATGYWVSEIAGEVLADRFYLSYTGATTQDEARIRRFYTSDGSSDVSYSYKTIFDKNHLIKDMALTSSEDYSGTRIYHFSILDNDSIVYFWDNDSASSWSELVVPVGNADRGLDVTYNYGSFFLAASYVGTDDSLYVVTRAPWTVHGPFDYVGSSVNLVTSISSYEDTTMTIFPASNQGNFRYRVSYNGGSSWVFGTAYTHSGTEYSCDITARGGDGFGMVLQGSGSNPAVYRHRTYECCTWTGPDTVSEYTPRYNVKPAIERIGSNIFGIVYSDWPSENAYFDRTDWTGVEEEEISLTTALNLSRNLTEASSTINFSLAKHGFVRISIFDVTGRLIKRVLDDNRAPGVYSIDLNMNNYPGGVYFINMKTPDGTLSEKLTLLK